jgi:hypothetical protein
MGRPEFENQTEITAQSSKSIYYLKWEDTTTSVLVGFANSQRITIYSPVNTVSRIINADVMWYPIAGASGDKTIFIDNQLTETEGMGVLSLTGAFGAEIRFDTGTFQNTSTSKPLDTNAASQRLTQTTFDDVKGLTFVYFNNTNVASAAKRTYRLFVEREIVKR